MITYKKPDGTVIPVEVDPEMPPHLIAFYSTHDGSIRIVNTETKEVRDFDANGDEVPR